MKTIFLPRERIKLLRKFLLLRHKNWMRVERVPLGCCSISSPFSFLLPKLLAVARPAHFYSTTLTEKLSPAMQQWRETIQTVLRTNKNVPPTFTKTKNSPAPSDGHWPVIFTWPEKKKGQNIAKVAPFAWLILFLLSFLMVRLVLPLFNLSANYDISSSSSEMSLSL